MRPGMTLAMSMALAALTAATPARSADAAPAERAPREPRFRLVGNVSVAPQTQIFDSRRTIPLYVESGEITTRYEAGSALSGDLGLQFNFKRRLGVLVAVAFGSRDETAEVTARLPHPLYLNRPRTVTPSFPGSYGQLAAHLSLAASGGSGSFEYTLFAGPSLYQVEADLLRGVTPLETYPYDEASVRVLQGSASKSGFGGHIGGRADKALGKSFGVGLQARYGVGTVTLESAGAETEIKPGGFEIGAGLRIRF